MSGSIITTESHSFKNLESELKQMEIEDLELQKLKNKQQLLFDSAFDIVELQA